MQVHFKFEVGSNLQITLHKPEFIYEVNYCCMTKRLRSDNHISIWVQVGRINQNYDISKQIALTLTR